MYRIYRLVVLCLILVFCSSGKSLAAWSWGSKNLVTINGISYTSEEFKQWWQIWKEAKSMVKEEPQEFIKWKIMVQEAEIMELDKTADFQNNVDVFLNARTRMLLKYDEVDSKLKITEQDIQDRFDADYNPIWRVTALYFAGETEAMEAYQSINEKNLTLEELKSKSVENGGPQQVKQGDVQPLNLTRKGIFSVVPELAEGEISAPQPEKNLFVIIHLDERKAPATEDFTAKRNSISHQLRKEKEGKLTTDFLNGLRQKFAVQVDEDLVEHVISGTVTEDMLDQPMAKTNRENIPLRVLVRDFQVEMKMLGGEEKLSQERKKQKAQGLVNGIIYDFLLTWEAQDRKYETKEPFKWSYDFFRENRLVKKYEAIVLGSQVSVTDDEIKKYYQEHISEFNTMGIYTYTMLNDERSKVEKVWKEIELGQDFFIAAKKFDAKLTPKRDMPANRVKKETLAAIKDLKVGQVSQPFEIDGELLIVKLVDSQPPQPMPLERVSNEINKRISRQKFKTIQRETIERLLSQSDVNVNQREWKRVRQELTK